MAKMTSGMMRNYNKQQIYRLIYEKRQVSRQSVSEELRLSLPTVNQKLKTLEEEKLIEKNGFFQSTGGRKSFVYRCVSNARIAIGAHITAHHIRIVAVDLYGNIIKRMQLRAAYAHDVSYYRMFGEQVNEFVRSMKIAQKRILGVGIALTALLSKDRQSVAKSILLGSSSATLADFKEWIDYPCQLFHDSEAAADAELWFSPEIQDALYLGLNYHLNGMLIMNGHIHVGKEFTGGVVEHLTLYPHGKACYCGKQGCFSAYCSGHVLYDENSGERDLFFSRLREGDRKAAEKWTEYMNNLAIAIGSLVPVLDCDIILGGTIAAFMTEEDCLYLQQQVRSNYHYAPSADFVRLGHKEVDICASGAAISYIAEFMDNL